MAHVQADGITGMYRGTRSTGLGAEVKKRILMGTYALSAGHVDAFYKKALQVELSTCSQFTQNIALQGAHMQHKDRPRCADAEYKSSTLPSCPPCTQNNAEEQ